MNWQWFHRLGSPRWFYDKSQRWSPWLGFLALLIIVPNLIWVLAFVPADFKQGNSFRIFYLHVPTSSLAMGGYYVMALCGAVSLIWKMKLADMVMKCAAPMGAIFTFLALVTGGIWGKPTWGTYWLWDGRTTSTLMLFFLYMGVVAIQNAYQNQQMADKFSAILSLVGMVNIPIIYMSVNWWNTLHQPATIKILEPSTMHSSMLYPLFVMMIGFYFFYAWALFKSVRVEILKREYRTQWVKQIITNTPKF
ncbi:MAG: heme ABC transporter permease [Cellvibrionaceae bacterium]